MFSYPLIFSNEDEHIAHIQDNLDFYKGAIEDVPEFKKLKTQKDEEIRVLNERLLQMQTKEENSKNLELILKTTMEKMAQQEEELNRTRETLEDTKRLEELLKEKNGVSVVHKGICDEKYVEIIMKEVASENYFIDNSDGTQKMDVRLHSKDGTRSIGIECKDKLKITKADIDKFRRDKVLNKFHRSIFISTYPIKNIVEEENNILVKNDELFIVTKDPVFLGAVMKLYLNYVEEEDGITDTSSMIFDCVLDTYQTWQSSKSQLVKMDKAVLRMLNLHPEFTEKMKNKHIYMVTKSNMKDKGLY